MKRITFPFLFLVLAIACCQGLQGQDFSPSKGCFKATATLTPGYVLSQGGGRAHVHGFAEYFLNEKISLSGDVFFHAVQLPVSANWIHREAHGLFLGGYYHWTYRGHDIYVGFQSGLQTGFADFLKEPADPRLLPPAPAVSLVLGYTYYFNRWFHFFTQPRFTYARLANNLVRDVSDFRFSAGLGFHISSLTKRKESS
ncbi:MAG: hypothetical protein N2050_00540 [Flavobacteriales bacterium]|nr:hypothetical protein [Flavobacteriales bacterium]